MSRFKIWLFALLIGTPAAAQDVCGSYTVVAGDTLSNIAARLLGDIDRRDDLYALNAQSIGQDPSLIEVGTTLNLPCEGLKDERADVARVEPPDPADGPEKEEEATTPRALHILTGGPFVPFAGEALPEGGMITEMVRSALQTPGVDTEYTISFVNDRGAHLGIILPRSSFDLAYPWVYPDCARRPLTDAQNRLCTDYIASDPIYEYVVEVYARADSSFAEAQFIPDLTGARLCRPVGYPLDDLVTSGLLPGRITLIKAPSPLDCITMLDRGEVDVASMDARVTRSLVGRLNVQNPLVVLDALTRIDTLHVIAPKHIADARDFIDRVNLGISAIDDNGDWLTIADRHLNPQIN